MTESLILLIVLLSVTCLVLGYKRPWIGIVISPFVCLAIMVFGGLEDDPGVVMLGPGLLLATWLSVLLAPHDPEADLSPKRVVRGLLTTTGLLILAVVVAVVFGPWGAPMFVLVLLVAGSLTAYGLTARGTRAAIVFSTLNASMRQNLPLPMALDCAAAGRDDNAGYVMRQISRWLVRGHTLSEAIRLGYPRCPAHAYGMVAAAERIGQLPAALGIIERDMHAKAVRRSMVSPLYPVYPVVLMVLIFLQVSVLMKFVIPQFRSVLRDMIDAPLPPATQFLMDVHRAVGEWLGLAFVLVVLCTGAMGVLHWLRPRRSHRPGLLSRAGDFLTWHLPILHWFQRNQSLAETIAGLRMSLAAGCTVDQAIANTLPLDVNACFRARLARWLRDVQRGQDVAAAAIGNRVGSALAWAFDTRVNQGNTPAVLDMLESFYRSNYSYRVNLARFVLWPSMTLAMACIVGFVACAIFSPIVAAINACINYIP